MTAQVVALVLTFVVHVVGAVVLIWLLLDGQPVDWRGLLGGGGGDDPGPPRDPEPRSPSGGIPLADAEPAASRLREPGRLADARPAPSRRPDHPPVPSRRRPRSPSSAS